MPHRKLDKFVASFPTKDFTAGEVILHQGDDVVNVYIIQTGIVKAYDINKEGEQKTVIYDTPGEAIPVSYIYTKADHALYYYEAYTDCKLALVPLVDFQKFMLSEPKVAFHFLTIMAERYLDFARRVNGLEQLKAEDKIIYSLDFLSRRFGDRRNPERVTVDIPLSQQEFADFVGLTRETVSGTMGKLRRKGVIQYGNGKGLMLNIKKISDLIEP
ncbi:Crp/Fnr family transcriptional regulator [Candidatus Saccharibacteria bacterium]|nr:Crp/Fnr family transcriptional regulator [Candidatus Saccharibacteria bacterium]